MPPGMTLEQMIEVMGRPPEPEPEPTTRPARRARLRGRFKPDDPATPQDEAWEAES